MAAASVHASGSGHLGLADNQKRWLVAGIALNKILIPQIRPFVEQGVQTEYNNLKTSHNIHVQSTSGRLQRWPARKVLKYENINGNDVHPRLSGGIFNYSLFDCRVTSHVDFARLYVEKYMAHFTAFDDHCDASAVLMLLGGVPVFSAGVQTAAGDVRMGRNDWAHCVFSKWDQVKFQQSFIEMEHLVRVMALPSADEGKLLGELKDWETKGTHLCMNSPVDPALLQLVQQELKSLQDAVEKMSVEFEEEKRKVQHELQTVATTLEERIQILEGRMSDFEADVNQKMEMLKSSQQNTESRTMLVEDQVHHLQEQMEDLTLSMDSNVSLGQDNPVPAAFPENLVELIRRDYKGRKGAFLCPFLWCEDELQMELSNIFTRLQIISKKKERGRLTDDIVNMTDVFKPHEECDQPSVVLIEGQPGMGKTTYCQKLAYDWSVEDIAPDMSFPKVEMLLLLKCRDMKTANIEEAIDNQLLPQGAEKREKENFFRFIRCNQSRILLVLDGLDELREDLFHCLLPLIQSKVFSNTYLMLTTRHEVGMKVRRYCDTLLEIVGYTSADADSYVTKYFSNHEDPSLAKKLIEKLTEDPQLRELTANPLNTALLCLVCEDTRGIFPTNRSKLYHELVSCALRRDFAKKKKIVPFDPVETCRDQLNHLGKMALKALKEDRMYFSEDETKCQSTDFLHCFLSREASVSKIRPIPCYAFTHKTFQEYFAAFHLAHELLTGDKAGRDVLLAQLSPVAKYWQVWEFLFKMVVSKSHNDAIYLLSRLCACLLCLYQKTPRKSIETKDDTGSRIRMCEDTSYDWVKGVKILSNEEGAVQNILTETLRLIAECECGEKELKDYQKKMVLTLARCLPVYKFEVSKYERNSLVIDEYLKANCTLSHLRLDGDLDKLGLATLKVVLQSDHRLVHLTLFGNIQYNFLDDLNADSFEAVQRARVDFMSMQVNGVKELTQLLHSNHTLTHLNLGGNWVFDRGAIALASFLQSNHTLTHLNLEQAMIFDFGAMALANALRSNSTLTHLSLPGNTIGDIGLEAIAIGLQFNCALVHLDLNKTSISNRGAIALATVLEQGPGLHSNVSLTYLDLHQKPKMWRSINPRYGPLELIGESGATALARALRTNCSLTYLDLQDNAIGNAGAVAIGEALKVNRNLTHLYLTNNEIGDHGAKALAEALQSEEALAQLNSLQQRCVDDSGVAKEHFALVKAVRGTCGTQLTDLDLSINYIDSTGATVLADALQYNNTLQRLDLSSNKIDCSGAAALAKALLSNQTLTHLGLRGNEIGDPGATEFAETLKYNDTLTFLNLTSNPIGELGVENLRQVDQSICSLKYDDPKNH